MGQVISIEHSKGGSGKTTTTANMGRGFQLLGNSVLLIDRDHTQGSLRNWKEDSNRQDYPDVVSADKPTLSVDVKKIASLYDWVIIDGASKLQSMAVHSIKASDLVLIPLQPSKLDIDACNGIIEIIKERQTIMDGYPKAAFLITREKKGTRLAKEINHALEIYDIPILESRISDSVIYATTMGLGKTVFEVNSSEAKEKAEEIWSIIKEIKERGLVNV
jgi:chromosome partitioning protein